ncbi:MAG: phage tail sheath family protein [Kordiimonadaceae bacterium]|nr:phage tail sheath family protein [Kordiimonadaceae bacterium]
MTVQLTYPGVYVEPIISPAPGDQGVATSITTFVGRTMMGQVNEPILLTNYGDYERYFGGLDQDSTISYSVQQFFNNGGTQAYVVRCFSPDIASPLTVEALSLVGQKLVAGAKALKAPINQAAVDTYLASQQAAAMGVDQWYIGKVRTDFDAGMKTASSSSLEAAAEPAAKGAKGAQAAAAGPDPVTVLQEVSAAAVPPFPAFTGLLEVNPANAAFGVINAVTFQVNGQALMAPSNRQAVILAAQNAMSPYTGGLTHNVAQALKNAMDSALPTSYQPGTTAAAAAYGAVGTALDTYVVTPVQAQLTQLATDDPKTGAEPNFIAFQTTLTNFSQTAGGAAAVLTAGYTVLAVPTPAQGTADPSAANVLAAMVTAAGTNVAGLAIVAAAKLAAAVAGAMPLDVMAAGVQGTMDYLTDGWQPYVDLQLQASSPGGWSNNMLSVSVNSNGITPQVAAQKKLAQEDLFNLVVSYVTPDGIVASENHTAVTLKEKDTDGNDTSNNLQLVLTKGSLYVRVLDGATLPAEPPMNGSAATATGGVNSNPLKINDYIGDENGKAGIYALKKVPIFNIMCIPPDDPTSDTDSLVYSTAASFCVTKNAMLIIDPPALWATEYEGGNIANISLNDLGSFGAPEGRSSAIYFPRIIIEDTLLNGAKRTFPASGALAGQWALADSTVGVWDAPAGLTSALNGISGLEITMSDSDNGVLNPQGINCLRTFPVGGTVVWGARTLRGATALADEYRYIPVRRLLLYIMDWLEVNTRWAVFEPNDEKLWSELRLQIGTFMKDLFKEGALVGKTADEALFVRCDASTTTPTDQDNGIVRVQVGFAPVKPAEFVVITVEQILQNAGS